MGNECHACENVKDQQNRFQKFDKVGKLATPLQIKKGDEGSTMLATEEQLEKNTYFKR
jgi:hypothetical protein